jgi:hypothetical protein
MIAMSAMMGGTMRSPLTGIVFTLELSHDLNVLPGLLVGSVAALGVTVLLLRRSILTEKLARRGQHIVREYSVDLLELMRVGEVMDKEAPIVPAETTVAELSNRIARGDPVVSKPFGGDHHARRCGASAATESGGKDDGPASRQAEFGRRLPG